MANQSDRSGSYRTGYNPQGDQFARRRRIKRVAVYDNIYFDSSDIRPYDILLTRHRSLISTGIVFFSGVDGRRAWLSHCAQVLGDGRTLSEANYPHHEFTPVEKYLRAQEEGRARLTLVRISDRAWPSVDFRERAQTECEAYHRSIAGSRYDAIGLMPMMMVSILRGMLPWLKMGAWDAIPEERKETIFICSAIVDHGWGWAQREAGIDWFPSTLSMRIPSPQDIYDSTYTDFIGGWRKVYRHP